MINDRDGARLLDEPREHPFPGNVLMHLPYFAESSNDPDHDASEVRTVVDDVEHAAVVTSLMTAEQRKTLPPWQPIGGTIGYVNPQSFDALHRPVIDLDVPARLVPSTTEGHGHLYIDQPMTWEAYLRLLDALAHAGVVEPGYVHASTSRGHTAVRVPWLRKGDPSPELPVTLVDRIRRCATRDELAALYVDNVEAWGTAENDAAREVATERWAA